MSDLRDFTGKNRRFTGTDAETMSSGTTAQRVNGAGKLRFNTTTNLMEYYDGTDWKAIDAPPVISGFTVDDVGGSSVTSATVDNEKTADSGNFTIEVLGSLFDTTGAGVTFIATAGNGETINTESITRNSANKLTVTVDASSFDVAQSPYTIRVTNGSGLSANLEACLTADADAPTFTNSADTNFDIYDGARGSGTIAAASLIQASPLVGTSSNYAVQSGSLPGGCTLNTTSGDITWSSVSAVGSDTQSTFTIRVTGTEATADRQFKITVKAPNYQTYSSTGSFTFNVPTGISTVQVLAIAGGGSGGTQVGGGGGAAGMIEHSAYPVTPGGSVSGQVGRGGEGHPTSSGVNQYVGVGGSPSPGNFASPGEPTTFGNITANGGGAGGNHSGPQPQPGQPGGSGGGGGSSGGNNPGGSSTGNSAAGGSSHGNGGGHGHGGWSGGGGGGAGGGGSNSGSGSAAGPGGSGRSSSYSGSSVTYAGGGSGGQPSGTRPSPGSAGGGGFGGDQSTGGQNGTNGKGGGGGGVRDASGGAGDGGSGVVILKY